jgi:peptidoglycan/LPS O-acetylase OafA/YrhL
MTAPASLHALTPLRFIAAGFVFLHHAIELPGVTMKFHAEAGVALSFFFVLSGFILTHAYPDLDASGAWSRFYQARVARLLPAYLGALAVGFLLLRYPVDAVTLLPFLTMTQAWIPSANWYFGYNSVAWSVSTEMFFYLVFPFLLRDLDRTCGRRLALAAGALLAMMALAIMSGLPVYLPPGSNRELWNPDIVGLLYTNPLSRLFEFTFGMVTASLWRRNRLALHSLSGSLWEIIAPLALALSVTQGISIYRAIEQGAWDALAWAALSRLLTLLGIAATIVVFANGRGAVSRLLSRPTAVFLGDISFSFYLLHQILLYVWISRFNAKADVPVEVSLSIVFAASLIGAIGMRYLVELPGQRWLKGRRMQRGGMGRPLVPARRTQTFR